MQVDKAIVYCEREGYRGLEIDIYRSDDGPVGPRPLLLYIHGGGFRLSHRSRAPRETRAWSPGFFERLTSAGFTVAANDYRFSGEALFPACVEDCKEAVRWLRANASDLDIDPDRFVVWGFSGGGYLATWLGVATDVGPIAGVACWYPITDMRSVDQQTPDSFEALLLGGPIGERPELAEEASPTAHVHPDVPPFHLVHGADDAMVAVDQSVRLQAALQGVGTRVELEVVEGADHFFDGSDDVAGVFDRSLAFLTERVGL